MFEVENDVLELRFNMQKVKTLENMYGISLMAELSRNRGMLSFHLMEGLFSVALYNTTQEQNVKGQKAIDIYNSLMQEQGYATLNAVIVSKLQDDMGFLFRGN
ncbi:segregation and condensation protein B [Bacillus sp. FSL K6-3431]|uniref:segregation and condensation protein B n=1 Tax=Bacillus sp. FSL K6-3431 TaxID=2921500 RepID=UPI0030FA6B6C